MSSIYHDFFANVAVYINFSVFFAQEVKKMENIDELESFLLKHGENIVDMLGGEIDRIELKLKVRYFKTYLKLYAT